MGVSLALGWLVFGSRIAEASSLRARAFDLKQIAHALQVFSEMFFHVVTVFSAGFIRGS